MFLSSFKKDPPLKLFDMLVEPLKLITSFEPHKVIFLPWLNGTKWRVGNKYQDEQNTTT